MNQQTFTPRQIEEAFRAALDRIAPRQTMRRVGTVQYFSAERGFGKLLTDHGDELFFELRSVRSGRRYLKVGTRVTYHVGVDWRDNPAAVDVRVEEE